MATFVLASGLFRSTLSSGVSRRTVPI